jgi:HPt (histidine-containing phosphotransfer) domain-containing protein
MEQVGELISLDDTLGVLADFVGMYTEQAPERLAALRVAFTAGDLEEVGRIAHSFKGASANLGAIRVAEVARRLEHAGRDKDDSSMAGWLDELEARYLEARDALRGLVAAK